jgi:plasmid stabilization system protein ParE
MIPIEISAAARIDYEDAWEWYFRQNSEAAESFEAAFQAALTRIEEGPHRLPFIDRSRQYCLMPRFPYQLIYRVKEGHVRVIAVAHAKRRPNFWRRRK